MIEIRLPLPPSVNALYANANTRGRAQKGKGRYPTPAYKRWLAEADAAMMQQKPRPVVGEYDLWLYLEWPDNRARDLGNYEKAVSDFLVSRELVEDDSKCQAMHIYRGLRGRECVVRVCERKPS